MCGKCGKLRLLAVGNKRISVGNYSFQCAICPDPRDLAALLTDESEFAPSSGSAALAPVLAAQVPAEPVIVGNCPDCNAPLRSREEWEEHQRSYQHGPRSEGSRPASSGSQPASPGSQPASPGSQTARPGSQPARPGSQLEGSRDMFDSGSGSGSGSEEPSQLEGSRLEEWNEMVERGANARGRVASTPGKSGPSACSPSTSPVRSQEQSQALVSRYQPGQVVRLGGVVSAVHLAHCRQVECHFGRHTLKPFIPGAGVYKLCQGEGGVRGGVEWGGRTGESLRVGLQGILEA